LDKENHSVKKREPMTKQVAGNEGRRGSNIPCLACAFFASATTGGAIYCFGVLADDLKRALQISQMQLGAISAAFFTIGGLLSWLPGMVVDRMKMRFSMAWGGILGAFFTTLYWILCRYPDLIPGFMEHPVGILSVLAIAISLSCGLIVASTFKLTLQCGGPDGKGLAVGVAKGFVGLGSGVYATIFQAIRTDKESTLDFLLVIAFFFIVCATLPACFLLPPKEEFHPQLLRIETTSLHFRTMYAALTVLGIYILCSALLDIQNIEPVDDRNFGQVLVTLILWLGPIVSLMFLPRKGDEDHIISNESTSLIKPAMENGETVQGGTQSLGSRGESEDVLSPPSKELSLPQMLQTSSAWIMLWITLVLVGSGTAKTNNMGQMVDSLGFSQSVTTATLAIFSVGQALSRISTGILSEAALHWNVALPSFLKGEHSKGIPRPFFLVIASFVMFLAHLVLTASTSLVGFVIGCACCAIAFGMAWPLMVLIVGDVFGVEHHGANYMFFDGGTKCLGTWLLSEMLTGYVYEAHVDHSHGSHHNCWGPECFRDTHLATSALAVTCLLASLLLCYQTRSAY
jgi:MFS family permease